MIVNWMQELKDTFNDEVKRHAELTSVQLQRQFLNNWNDYEYKTSNDLIVKENDKGIYDVFLTKQSNAVGDDANVEKDSYVNVLSKAWNQTSKETIEQTKNPFAQGILRQFFKQAFAQKKQSWIKSQDSLLQTHGVGIISNTLEELSKTTSVKDYDKASAALIGTITNSYISPILKQKLIQESPQKLANSLLTNVSLSNPDDILNSLQGNNPIWDVADTLIVHKAKNTATKTKKESHELIIAEYESTVPDKIASLKDNGLIDKEFFYNLNNLYLSSAKPNDKVKALKLQKSIIDAEKYYELHTNIEKDLLASPLNKYEDIIEQYKPSPNSNTYLQDKVIYNQASQRFLNERQEFENDPALAADKISKNKSFITNLYGDVDVYEKRLLIQKSKGVLIPKVLTEGEKKALGQLILNSTDNFELNTNLEEISKNFNILAPQAIQELSSNKEFDSFLKVGLKYYSHGEIGQAEEIFNLRQKVKSGTLKEKNFSNQDEIKTLKFLINTDGESYKNFSDHQQEEIKEIIYESAKNIYANSSEKMNINEVIHNSRAIFFNNYYTEGKNYVPKTVVVNRQMVEITPDEAFTVNNNLSFAQNSIKNWEDEKLERIFGKIDKRTSYIKNNQVSMLKTIAMQGKWVLTQDNQAYVYQINNGNKVFYDVDSKGDLKLFPLKNLLH